ncbi:MAG: rhodanese-like domain-containing protein [Deltaproteobacteria bacterium]|nr:rhodanese-like domain-containing protein [Deltaproteobacteria bacterium]MBN2672093.1 rhodanese-like domain-containing protein [Deltaproteobacteria bacterium]
MYNYLFFAQRVAMGLCVWLFACSQTGNTKTNSSNDELLSTDSDSNENGADTDTDTDTAAGCTLEDTKYLSVDKVHKMFSAECPNILYLNVVDEEFYSLGHIAGSVEIPWDTLDEQLNEIPTDVNIIIYCRRGVRSEDAYETLSAADYNTIWIMEGGIEAWTAAGYSVDPI